ncbi:MAG: hypothetical protein EON88_19235 [Brevundimonas sp.]|nr:MAG: hypothetical protein EON88_19235 [Brevundimonas sp.]
MRLSPLAALAAAGLLAACATAPAEVAGGPPVLSPLAAEPVPANGRLYANCIGQAAEAGAYDRAHDADTELLLFTCTGQPAREFFDGLAGRSAAIGSEYQSDGRTMRSTNAVQRNLFGVDYCSHGAGDDYACVISLNAGAFLTAD